LIRDVGPSANSTAIGANAMLCGMAEGAIRIAIVEDDPAVRKALARLLSASSFEVMSYESARDFVESDHAFPECLVLDVHMPDVGGLDLRQQLRRDGREVPTVFITALDAPGLRERCLSIGASAFLLKPLSRKGIVDAIHSVTRRQTEGSA
jgi:FixJ family two-component response regulator